LEGGNDTGLGGNVGKRENAEQYLTNTATIRSNCLSGEVVSITVYPPAIFCFIALKSLPFGIINKLLPPLRFSHTSPIRRFSFESSSLHLSAPLFY
jgi:hypothetical protein